MSSKSSKIKVKISSFDNVLLNKSCNEIIEVAKQSNSIIKGPIFLPTKISRYVVNRSPHIDKKSREVLFLHTHSRLIYIDVNNTDVLKSLQSIKIQPGVGIKVNYS